jgi:membrane-associated protease RseP (regulator of RpoE activity)
MRVLLITSLIMVLGFQISFAQLNAPNICKWGFSFQNFSANKCMNVTEVVPGSLADLADLRAGDEIVQVDGQEISDMSDSKNMLETYAGPVKKLRILRFGTFLDLDLLTISGISNIDEYLTEGILYTNVKTRENKETGWAEYYFKGLAMQMLSDRNKDLSKYQSYRFEYSNTANPLEEKKLAEILGRKLDKLGLKRTNEHPELTVSVIHSFNAGNNDNYVELRFTDTKEYTDSKLPIVVWKASMNLKVAEKDIFYFFENFFDIVLYQFPVIREESPQRIIFDYYRFTGIIYDKSAMKTVLEVLPGSPAALAGIQPGDRILKIDGNTYPSGYADLINPDYQTVLSEKAVNEKAERSGIALRYLKCCQEYFWPNRFNCGNSSEIPVVFTISRNGKKLEIRVIPDKKRIISILD